MIITRRVKIFNMMVRIFARMGMILKRMTRFVIWIGPDCSAEAETGQVRPQQVRAHRTGLNKLGKDWEGRAQDS